MNLYCKSKNQTKNVNKNYLEIAKAELECWRSGELKLDLISSTETKYQVQSWFFLDVVVTECAAILELFTSED